MSWTTPTETDIRHALNSAELDEFLKYIETCFDENPIELIISDAVQQVRGYMALKGPLSVAGISPSLKNDCLDIIVYRIAKACSISTETQRKDAHDAALKRLVSGQFSVEDPSDATAILLPKPSFDERTQEFTRETQDGM